MMNIIFYRSIATPILPKITSLKALKPRPLKDLFNRSIHPGNSLSDTSKELFDSKISNLSILRRPYSSQEDNQKAESAKAKEFAENYLRTLSTSQKEEIYRALYFEFLKDKYEIHLGSDDDLHHFLSKYGRPTAMTFEEDHQYCEIPKKWYISKTEDSPKDDSDGPSSHDIWTVFLINALPFIGFGFLDNLIMILAGDYIDNTIGVTLGISTMAAAALGNTISDMAGIGSSVYVERLAEKVGIKEPKLCPAQLKGWKIRGASSMGRLIGVIIGCIVGMFPLLFHKTDSDTNSEDKETTDHRSVPLSGQK